MTPDTPFSLTPFQKKCLVFAVLAFAGFEMASMSWLKWSDLLIDYGEEVYLTWQVSEGKVLYRDLAQVHGPLSIYTHALIFNIFGPGLLTLALFNMAIVAGLCWIIYNLIRNYSDRATATLCAIAFITLFAFGQYQGGGNYNFIGPYVYELSHGVALGFLSINMISLYFTSKSQTHLALAYFFSGLVFLTKPELFAAAIAAVGFGTVVSHLLDGLERSAWIRSFLTGLGALIIGPLIFFIYFSFHMPPGQALISLFTPWINVMKAGPQDFPYYQWVTGLGNASSNLLLLLKYFGLGALIFFLILAANRMADRLPLSLNLARIALGILTSALLYLLIQQFPLLELLRPLPLILALLLAFYLASIFKRRKHDQGRELTIVTFAVFSLCCLLKIILNVHIFHYGFALALPGTLLVLSCFLYEIPANPVLIPGSRLFYRAAAPALVLLIIFSHVSLQHMVYQLKTLPIGTGRDTIIEYDPSFEPRGTLVTEAIQYIQTHLEPGQGIATIPSGNMINYLTRHPNPLKIHNFNALLEQIVGDSNFLENIRSVDPEYILFVEEDPIGLRARFFGQDYAQKTYQWIRANYSIEKQFGDPPFTHQGFGMQLLRKNPEIGNKTIQLEQP